MTQIYNKAIHKTISINRVLGHIKGVHKGATIVFFAGIHGNETAGVFALQEVLDTIKPETVSGTIYGVSGNLKALKENQRYLDKDLNRLWTQKQLEALKLKETLNTEEQEQIELFKLIERIISSNSGPFYFIDFHTTSSKTLPFITINDALINRKFSKLFPVPIVLGIEEYLNGPLLSFINELGYVSLGFESGQHDEKEAIENCISFIYLALRNVTVIEQKHIPQCQVLYQQLQINANHLSDIFEVVYLYHIKRDEVFKMNSGFKSFQDIVKGTILATSNQQMVKSTYNARLFMPLYQSKGEEGFFIIKPIKPFFLKLSAGLRHLKFDSLLVLFPGISWDNKNKNVLKVNLNIAKFFAKSIFHLLGYRNKKINETHLLLYNREHSSKIEAYKNELWY
ncbi:succinylglutamate desuccinylase/aspartoacylase family protein [Psychroserpens burtonensis]|uniref:succinylglutamate desuccinylase/aspartoacylase family protein n=1 Tax=Psychroserpens burtonensis TaxID=49278 RepID=UPI00042728EC|nr:succinylglutamate desuccinylase/aspartoacylase family protein [Psychroserpens burtonensis]